MPSGRDKKLNTKLLKVSLSSDSDSDDSVHELSYYAKDKVRLMKEILKLIKPKKIKSMAPECIKDLDIVEINSMLLEELLGISNKRLMYVFNGENVDRETSSSESDEDKQPIDVISLDDISDDDIEFSMSQSDNKFGESCSVKVERSQVVVKKEKSKRKSNKPANTPKERDELMSVLELLELQARARAIRSQLALETDKKSPAAPESNQVDSDSDDAILIESMENKEIIIMSSDSDDDGNKTLTQEGDDSYNKTSNDLDLPPSDCHESAVAELCVVSEETQQDKVCINPEQSENANESRESSRKRRKEQLLAKIQKIKLVRQKKFKPNKDGNSKDIDKNKEPQKEIAIENIKKESNLDINDENRSNNSLKISDGNKTANFCDNDEIVINLDENEMDDIEND